MSLRILFVDKGEASSGLLVPSLERKGSEVVTVHTLSHAQSRLASFRPDMIVVDVASFGRTGNKVCEGIRAQAATVPCILLVEKGSPETGHRSEECIAHPCSSRSLLRRVAKLAKNLASRELQVGPLLFEPDARCVRRSGRTSLLRPKEAALLTYFIQNVGRVLTREEIIRTVWETDYIRDTRTLSVHVRWLREKIEEDPHHPQLLRTVRGVGYRFDPSEELERS